MPVDAVGSAVLPGSGWTRYTQARRPMRVDTVLDPDTLLLERVEVTERLSEPFHFHLGMCSEKSDLPIDALVRQPILVTLELRSGGVRHFHGLTASISQGHRDVLPPTTASPSPPASPRSKSTASR